MSPGEVELLDAREAPGADRGPVIALRADRLRVFIYPDRDRMGQAAAGELSRQMRRAAEDLGELSCVFAAAPSQDDVLRHLVADPTAPWERVSFAGQMDEYVGVPETDPRSFRWYLETHLWGPLRAQGRLPEVYPLHGDAPDPRAECARYAELLRQHPPDVVQGGLGEENAHLAFNDPPEARFDDPELVKLITVAPEAKWQQVHEGHFADISQIPDAVTLTVPALTRFALPEGRLHEVRYWSCVAPTRNKATAVERLLLGPVTEAVPGSILRTLPDAALFLDAEAATRLHERGVVDVGKLS